MRTRGVLCCLLVVLSVSCGAAAAPNGLIVLLTDYGADSIYVGELKGAIYTKFPAARIDAISNSVPPFDILCGAYMLAEACKEFPAGTTFCCVVDPGVGTARRCIVLQTKSGHLFVGPDNGLLSLSAEELGVATIRTAANTDLWRTGVVSRTFHGRDIFGPVAAAVAQGVSLAEIGPEIKDLVTAPVRRVRVEGDTVYGAVIRSDTYGNLVTNLSPKHLAGLGLNLHDTIEVAIGTKRFTAPWESTYSDVPEGRKVILVQSMGRVECAINMGNLAEELGEGLHAQVTFRKAE